MWDDFCLIMYCTLICDYANCFPPHRSTACMLLLLHGDLHHSGVQNIPIWFQRDEHKVFFVEGAQHGSNVTR